MDDAILVLTVCVALAFAYPLLRRWQLERARPVRIRLAELGAEMLASPNYTTRQRNLITDILQEALDWRFMARAVVLFPMTVWKVLSSGLPANRDLDALTKDDRFRELMVLHFRSTSVANPLCAIIVRIEIGVVVAFIVSAFVAPYLIAEMVAKVTPEVRRMAA